VEAVGLGNRVPMSQTGYALDSGKSGVMMRCDRGLSEASHGV
jgi:hypothetical protein